MGFLSTALMLTSNDFIATGRILEEIMEGERIREVNIIEENTNIDIISKESSSKSGSSSASKKSKPKSRRPTPAPMPSSPAPSSASSSILSSLTPTVSSIIPTTMPTHDYYYLYYDH